MEREEFEKLLEEYGKLLASYTDQDEESAKDQWEREISIDEWNPTEDGGGDATITLRHHFTKEEINALRMISNFEQ